MLKLLGLLFVITASSLTGITLSSNLSKRARALETAVLLTEKLQTFLRYGLLPTKEILLRLSENERIEELSFLKNTMQYMEEGQEFPQAWKFGLKKWKTTYLKAEDKEALAGIADILGGSDAESQKHALELTADLLNQNLENALNEKNTIGKLYRSLGFLFGIGIAIFLI